MEEPDFAIVQASYYQQLLQAARNIGLLFPTLLFVPHHFPGYRRHHTRKYDPFLCLGYGSGMGLDINTGT
jgi:hypothetical protein